MIVRGRETNFLKRIIYSLIAKSLIGRKFIIKDWLIGYDYNKPVYDDVQFIIRGYDKTTQELDIDIAEVYVSTFIEEYRKGRIKEVI